MADGIVQVPPDSSGKRIDTSELLVNGLGVERQRIVIASPTNAIALAEVVNSALTVHVDNPQSSIAVSNFPPVQSVNVGNFPPAQSVSGTVNVGNFPATQPISGSVSVSNFPATQPISGAVSVSGSVNVANFPATQPVSGSVSVLNFPATQPISGAVSVTGSINVANFPASQAVTGTFWPTTQPVSGAVSVSNFPATQPVSGTVSISGAVAVTGTFWQATQPVSGTVSVSGSVAVTGTFWQATQPVSGTVSSKTQDGAGTNITSTGGALDVNVKTGNVQYTAPSGVAPSVPSPTGNVIFGYNATGKAVPILCALDGPLAVYTTNYVLACRDQASTGVNAPISSSASWIGGSDGTNLQGLLVDSAANKNLRVALYSAATAITNTTGALDVNIKSGSSAGTQYAEGTTAATPTGTVAMGQNPSGVINALNLDAAGNLLISGAATAGTPTTVNIGQAAPTSAAGGTQILAAKTTRVRMLITQMSTVPVYLGTSTSVTAANGDLLPGVVGYQKVYRNTAALWGLGSGGTGSISYVEEAA